MMPTNSSLHRNLSRVLLGGAVALSVLSCQTDPEPTDVPQKVMMRFSDTVTYRQPDSASWEFKGKAGPTAFGAKPGTGVYTATFEVPSTPGTDTVKLSCWRYGIRGYVVPGVGSGDLTVLGERVVRDSLALDVFKQHVLDVAEEEDFFTESAQGVRRTYARMLVARDTLAKGYPDRRPYGIDSAALVDEICVAMVRTGRPFDSLYSPAALGGDRAAWVAMVGSRVASKLLSARDSLALFPPPPVRLVTPISVVRDLVAGGDESGIVGAFAWDSGMVVLDAEILKDGAVVKGLVDVAIWQPQSDAEDKWDLEGGASIRARSKTVAGEYELRITARDAKGNFAVSSVLFDVADPPAGVPRVAVLEPSGSDTIRLAFGQESIHVVARVRNPSEVKPETFTIGGVKPKQEDDSTWSADVVVPPTGVAVIVGVRVEATNGVVGSEYFLAMRAKDSQAPKFERTTGAADAVVPFDSLGAYVSWTVSDNHKLGDVKIAGVSAMSLGNTWWSRVPLVVGKNVVRLEAIDSTGNKSLDSIVIARAKDLEAPRIVALEGTESQELVGEADLSVMVNWNVTDNHRVAKVEIAGEPAVHAGASGVWFRYVVVKEGDNKIVVRAWDSTGNESADSIQIRKSVNPDHPVLKALLGTYPRTVSFETTSIELGWQVLNPKCLGTVEIAGVATSGEDGRFLRKIDLPIGDTQVVVVATDTLGNVTRASVRITRKRDTIAPKCQAGPGSATIVDGKIRATVSWVVTDNHKLGSVKIEGVEATSVGNVHGRTVDVALDQEWIRIVASDSCGNQTRDSLRIVGTPDTLAPRIYAGAGANNRTVAADVSETLVSWIVDDDRDVVRVEIAGAAVDAVGTAYGRSVALATGKNTIRIDALDAAGNKSSSEVVIIRLDANGPEIVMVQGPSEESVGEATEAVDIFFKVADPQGVQSVTIDGTEIQGSAGVYNASVPLAFGKNSIEILAKDADGALSAKIIDVFRRDENAPVVTAKFGSAIQVGGLVTEYELAWAVSDNSGAFTATLDGKAIACADGICKATVPLVVGSNRFAFEAKDAAGLVTKSEAKILRSDELPPEVAMLAPSDPALPVMVTDAEPKTILRWTAKDNMDVISCAANGKDVAKDDAGQYVFEVDMTGRFGDSVVAILAKDAEGNLSVAKTVTIRHPDIAPPAIALVAPAPPTTVLGATDAAPKAVVRWTVSDNSGAFTTTANGKDVAKSASGEYALEVNMTGRYTDSVVVIASKDAAGNLAAPVSVSVRHADESAPTLTAVEPAAAGGMVWVQAGLKSALVKWKANDAVGSVECTVNGKTVLGDASGNFSVSIDMTNKVGDSVLKIVAKDKDGNISEELVATVRRDIAKPVVTKIAPVPANVLHALPVGTTSFTVKWSAADAGGLASTTINGVEFAATAAGEYTLPIDMALKDGDSAISIVAKDMAGNVSDPTKFVIRRDLAKPKVTKTNPGALVDTVWFGSAGTTFEVKWSVEDLGLLAVTINRDAVVASGTVFSRLVDMKTKTTDSTVWLVATDLAGNRSDTSKVVLRFDAVKPKVTVTNPTSLTTPVLLPKTTTSYVVKWTVGDVGGLAKTVINKAEIAATKAGTYTRTIDVSKLSGDSIIWIVGVDKAGNVSDTTKFTIRRDAVSPVVVKVTPAPAISVVPLGIYPAAYDVQWKVTEASSVSSSRINDALVTPNTSGVYTRMINMSEKVGDTAIWIVATDAAGNVSDTVKFVIHRDNVAPEVEWLGGAGNDTLVHVTTTMFEASWKVSDNEKLVSVEIGGVKVAGVDGVFSRSIPVVAGDNPISIRAEDASGTTMSTGIVVRRPYPIVDFAAGGDFAIYLDALGGVNVWGQSDKPTGWSDFGLLSGLGKAKAVGATNIHAVALLADNTVRIWNKLGQEPIPSSDPGLSGVWKMAVGNNALAVIKSFDSSLVVWGGEWDKSVGLGAYAPTKAINVACGSATCYAMKKDSTVLAWNSNGPVTVAEIPAGTKVKSIHARRQYGFIILKNDSMVVIGIDNGSTVARPENFSGFKQAAAGEWHALALSTTGRVVGWGGDQWQQASSTVSAPADIVAVAAGYRGSYGLRANGSVWVAGSSFGYTVAAKFPSHYLSKP